MRISNQFTDYGYTSNMHQYEVFFNGEYIPTWQISMADEDGAVQYKGDLKLCFGVVKIVHKPSEEYKKCQLLAKSLKRSICYHTYQKEIIYC